MPAELLQTTCSSSGPEPENDVLWGKTEVPVETPSAESGISVITARQDAPELFAGAYEFIELEGEGAMGAVWRARNVNLDKQVAIKLVKLVDGDPQAHTRLRNEARLAARINHANVVGVFDTGITDDGTYYMVMELLEGRDLSEYLAARGGRLPAAEAVALVLPLLSGLDCAHKKKILHRDIKPENIFLTASEEGVVPKLVDFGIALANDVPKDLRATRVGALLGTPLYMAPEQVRGSLEVDERTDLWGVCTVLYEAIAGQAPFQSDNLQSLFFSITCHPVPSLPAELCDEELAAILARGLEKDPARRFASARELGCALAAWGRARGLSLDSMGQPLDAPWLRGSSSSSPSLLLQSRPAIHSLAALARTEALPKRKSRWGPSVLGLGVLALGYFGLTWAHHGTDNSSEARAQASLGADESVQETAETPSPAPRVDTAAPSEATPPAPRKGAKLERPHRHVDPNWGF